MIISRANWYLLFVCILFSLNISAQEGRMHFERYGIDNGLPHDYVTSVAQDEKGFLWIGTANGLACFDGYSFKNYRNEKNITNSISNNVVRTVFADQNGNIWCGTSDPGMLDTYNCRLNKFSRYDLKSTNKIKKIAQDKSSNLWILFRDGGMVKFDVYTKTLTRFNQPKSGAKNDLSSAVVDFCIDSLDNVWAASNSDIRWLNEQEESWHFTSGESNNLYNSFKSILPVTIQNQRVIWAKAALGKLLQFDFYGRLMQEYKIEIDHQVYDGSISQIVQDTQNTIWFVLNLSGQIVRVQKVENGTIYGTTIVDDVNGLTPFGKNEINELFCDNQGNIWVATHNKLFKFSPYNHLFSHYSKEKYQGRNLKDDKIFAFLQTGEKEFLIATKKGMNVFSNDELYPFEAFYPNAPEELKNEEIWSLAKDADGNIWFGGMFVICKYSNNERSFTIYRAKDPNLPVKWSIMWSIHTAPKHQVWIGNTGSGILRLDAEKTNFREINAIPTDCGNKFPDMVSCFYTDEFGNTWFEAENHLVKFDSQTGEYQDQNCLSNFKEPFQLKCIVRGSNQKLWLGTEGQGLYCYDMEAHKFCLTLTEKDGLPDNTIFGILSDKSNNLWLTSNNGLCRLTINEDDQTTVITSFDKSNGLQGKIFTQGAYLKTWDGHFLVGGNNGFNFFNPDSIRQNAFDPEITFTGIQLLGKSVKPGQVLGKHIPIDTSIVYKNSIELNHHESNFTIEFSSLDFNNNDKISYSYLLEGFDQEWQFPRDEFHFATYTNIPFGIYLLKVRATKANGEWSDKIKTLNITILPPWWLKWWAFLIYSFILISASIIIWNTVIRERNLKRAYQFEKLENKKNQEIQQAKTEFFMNVSHEFKTPLTLILGPVEKLLASPNLDKNDQHYYLLIKRSAERLKRLISQLLDLRKLETSQMKLQLTEDNICGFISNIYEEFISLAEKKNIQFKLIKENVPDQLTAYFDKDKIEKIVSNILSNAFKYTPQHGQITLLIIKDGAHLKVIIEDSGIGIAADKLNHIFNRFYQVKSEETHHIRGGTGIGLSLTKELIELHHGEIDVSSVENEGTIFTLSIPLNLKGPQASSKPELRPVQSAFTTGVRIESDSVEANNSEDASKLLIIDDNEDIRYFMKLEFKHEFQILEAADGREGLTAALEHTPDLIICDIMMPVMDGIQFCKILKNDFRISHIPVIFLSAKSGEQSQLEGLESGANDYILKPFNSNMLRQKIKNLLLQREKQVEFYTQDIDSLKPSMNAEKQNDIELNFLAKAEQLILDNLSNEAFNAEVFAELMNMSYSNLYRKIKATTNVSLNIFIRNVRLKQAAKLLKLKNGNTISEIAFDVGFSSPNYFTKHFTQFFGMSPTDYLTR